MVFTLLNKLTSGKAVMNKQMALRFSSNDPGDLTASHKVDNWEKRFLVWTGRYKSLEEVPAFVRQDVMEKTRNKMRIKIANYMMVATVLGCCLMVYLGKRDAKQGKSVQQMNIDWHKKIKEDFEKEKADAALEKK